MQSSHESKGKIPNLPMLCLKKGTLDFDTQYFHVQRSLVRLGIGNLILSPTDNLTMCDVTNVKDTAITVRALYNITLKLGDLNRTTTLGAIQRPFAALVTQTKH